MASGKLHAAKAGEFLNRLPSLPIRAAALAQREGAAFVTGDRELKAMSEVAKVIKLFGPKVPRSFASELPKLADSPRDC